MEETSYDAHTNDAAADVWQQRQHIQDMARGFRQAQVLLSCVELGVFAALAQGPASAQEIAQTTGASPRGMELLLNAATALGLLEKHGADFSNGPAAASCLVPGSPGDVSAGLGLEAAFYRRWGHLAEAVRSGRRPEENRQDEQPEQWVRNFIYALYNMARPIAPLVAEALALPADRLMRVIDVGGGHGGYSIALAQRYPLVEAVVFELPRVAPLAKEIIAQAGLSERITVQEGNFQNETLGSGYDVALLFGVLNGESPAGRFALIQKAFAALNPAGQIILRDHVLDADRAGPDEAALFAAQMLLATESGGLDTREDWLHWLRLAGFNPPHPIALPEGAGAPLLAADKPA